MGVTSAKSTLEVRAGTEEGHFRWPVKLPPDDKWHKVHITLPAKLSRDGKTLYVGGLSESLAVFIDGEMSQEIKL